MSREQEIRERTTEADVVLVRELIGDYARYADHGDHDLGFRDDCEVCVALAALDRLLAELERERAAREALEVRLATGGLPPDLLAVLRDQSVIVPQDAAVFEKIAEWAKAPSNSAAGGETG